MAWHLITCEYPPDIGGISDHTAQLAGGLAAAGEDVHVWCPGRPGSAGESRAAGRADAADARRDGVRVHAVMGAFGRADLVRAGAALDACPGPRRLLVQWLPHGYGQRSLNLGFCVWVAGRAWRGDRVDLVVHEPFIELSARPARHLLMALVHRLMTVVLLRAVQRVWVSTPAWESRLRPFALGRPLEMRWLPVPGCESLAARGGSLAAFDGRCIPPGGVAPPSNTPGILSRRALPGGRLARLGATPDFHHGLPGAADAPWPVAGVARRPLVGHFGSYGALVTSLLDERLARVLAGASRPDAVLLGAGSEAFAAAFLSAHPEFAGRVRASGVVPPHVLAETLAACDVLLQPYPDGITVRRTSAMAGLAQGRPIVTTTGHLTEPSWAEQGAVALVPLIDVEGFAASAERLLTDGEARARLGARALAVYRDHFSVDRLVRTLRAVA